MNDFEIINSVKLKWSYFDTFTRTPVRVSKMNAAARAQLTLQMFTLLKKYPYGQSQY